MKAKIILTAAIAIAAQSLTAQNIERLKYGDFNSWITREISESSVIGGNKKILYEVGPTQTITGNKAYTNKGGSPWGTSNVYAKVSGIVKGSNAVEPFTRSGSNKCAKLSTKIETVKVLGIINMDVMVAGSMFLGQMMEPVTSTKNPYAKMDMGVPYTKRPKALVLDYKVDMPATNTRTKATGFGGKKTLSGRDQAVVFVYLQHRWEDEKGNLHAKRVGTAGKKFGTGTNWVNGAKIPFVYGDISSRADMKWLGLRGKDNAYHAKNSKGKLKPVIEEGYDANATPTHIVLMISSGDGEPFVGTEGLNFYIDNIGFQL
ncbi:MAG: PCMD domain-containing protein [Bacteroides sp.]|nr:PCMD domain-containing protein [Bacteroides sp.]MCM1414073.1 PCMD domain-containing protein [Bacteroides sp.]MCM1472328.1 PCMD domain-containing protein [Bacteroides sp.]